jgi:trimeric autotransporter adhesin
MRKSFTQILTLLLLMLFFAQASAQNINTIAGGLGDNGAATAGKLFNPNSVAVDKFGNIYISDYGNNLIRKIDATGVITSLATGMRPRGIVTDTFGNVYVADANSRRIFKIKTTGTISTYAGRGGGGDLGDGGPATAAELTPTALAFDRNGNLYAADNNNNSCKIRKIDTSGIITTVAGNGPGGFTGDGFAATLAKIKSATGVSVDKLGNIYIADNGNNRVRKVNATGIITTYAGNGILGYAGDGGPATVANFNVVTSVFADTSGNVFVADNANNEIRMINSSGIINRIAGSFVGGGYSGDGGSALTAQLNNPTGINQDIHGNLFIADHNYPKLFCLNSAHTFG